MATAIKKYFKVNGELVDFEPSVFPTWVNLFGELQQKYPKQIVECGWVYDDGSTMCMEKTRVPHGQNLDHLEALSDEKRTGVCEEPGDSNSLHDVMVATKHVVRNGLWWD